MYGDVTCCVREQKQNQVRWGDLTDIVCNARQQAQHCRDDATQEEVGDEGCPSRAAPECPVQAAQTPAEQGDEQAGQSPYGGRASQDDDVRAAQSAGEICKSCEDNHRTAGQQQLLWPNGCSEEQY